MRFRPLLIILIVLANTGMFIAAAISLSHYMRADLPCTMAANCSAVLNHSSSSWFGIPVSAVGFLGYAVLATMFCLMGSGLINRRLLWNMSAVTSGIGFVTSAYLQYYSFTVIKARCEWCISSALVMTIIFVGTLLLRRHLGEENEVDPSRPALVSGAVMLASLALTAVVINGDITDRNVVIVGLDQYKVSDLVGEPDKYAIGPKDAKITVVEFADIFCPGCRRSYGDFHTLLASPKLNNKIRFIYRHYPLTGKEGHELSDVAAMAVEFAASKGKFKPMLDAFFYADEEQIRQPAGIAALMDKNGVSSAEFQKELEKGSLWMINAVEDDKARATKAGIASTPTYIIFADGIKTRQADARGIQELWDRPEYAALLK